MKVRIAAVLLTACVLGGCTDADWDHAFSYAGLGDAVKRSPEAQAEAAPAPAPEAQPVAQAAANTPSAATNEWCVEVGKAAQDEATGQGFDVPTQQRRAQLAFQQCMSGPGTAPN